MNYNGLHREIARTTKQTYSWTGFWTPKHCTYGKEHWQMRWELKRKFLNVNYRFASDGRKIKVWA